MKALPTFIPVIHVQSAGQAVRQARLAMGNGAGGVFLIAHEGSFCRVLDAFAAVRFALPDAWVGVNFLDLSPAQAIATLPDFADALWIDNGLIDDACAYREEASALSRTARQFGAGRRWRLFAGVDFKYQRPATSPALAARLSADLYDVCTTSGQATGQAPAVDKLRSMKLALGSSPLALASGASPENVGELRPYVDCFMVATGISRSFYEFCPAAVRAMAELVARSRKEVVFDSEKRSVEGSLR